jgi:hypothetical protein
MQGGLYSYKRRKHPANLENFLHVQRTEQIHPVQLTLFRVDFYTKNFVQFVDERTACNRATRHRIGSIDTTAVFPAFSRVPQ